MKTPFHQKSTLHHAPPFHTLPLSKHLFYERTKTHKIRLYNLFYFLPLLLNLSESKHSHQISICKAWMLYQSKKYHKKRARRAAIFLNPNRCFRNRWSKKIDFVMLLFDEDRSAKAMAFRWFLGDLELRRWKRWARVLGLKSRVREVVLWTCSGSGGAVKRFSWVWIGVVGGQIYGQRWRCKTNHVLRVVAEMDGWKSVSRMPAMNETPTHKGLQFTHYYDSLHLSLISQSLVLGLLG